MLDTRASGVYIIAATPFTDDGAVDTASLDRLIDFYVGCGITGVTVLGIMGEAPKLTHAESVALTRQVVRRVNGLPVVVGASSPGFASMGALVKDVMDAGAGGVMIAPPSTLKTDDQIVAYYANAVEAIGDDVPFVLQDYPYASGVFMAPSVIRRIVTDNPSCKMVKHEEWPGLEKLTALKNLMADGSMRKVAILCGNGGVFLPHELERGADGANTGYAYPEMLVQLVQADQGGRARGRARPVRPAPAAAALRAAARNARARGAQICPQAPRRDRHRCAAQAGDQAFEGSDRRDRVPDRTAGAEQLNVQAS